VHVQIDGTTKALDKRHRPRLRFLPHGTACDRDHLVDAWLANGVLW
jgi:hypothetical protein